MIICPYCDFSNIEGNDHCEQCGQSMDDLHLRDPSTLVERSLLQDRVSTLESRPPVVVEAETPVADVLRLLVDREIGCVFVVDGQRHVVGVFSERDALFRLNAEVRERETRPIAEFMTRGPQSLQSTAKIAFAVRIMDQGGYRHVPLVDQDNRPTGVVSARDILRYLTEKMRDSASATQPNHE